ncbi:MAG: M23 family metallopeptidase [Elusimicrobiota bacterium]
MQIFLLLSAVFLLGQEPSGDQYLVDIGEKGESVSRFCAEIAVKGNEFRLRSEAHTDVRLVRESAADGEAAPGPGVYRMSLGGRAVPVTAGADGGSLLFVSAKGTTLRLTQAGCPSAAPPVKGWYSPFMGGSRKAIGAIEKRVVGQLGDYRASRRAARRHAGVDLRGDFSEEVYPVAAGRVVGLSFRALTGTVVIKHDPGSGRPVYSKYIHLQDIPVKVGQEVSPETRIGRLFDEAMLGRTHYRHNHLHLEIRKSYADKGQVSSHGQSIRLLRRYCYDPVDFLSKHMKAESLPP